MSQPDKLTEEQYAIVEKGIQAEALLLNAAFATAVNDLSTELTNKLLSTLPHEKREREDLFFTHKALQALVDTLKQSVTQRMIVEHQALADEESAKEEQNEIQE